MAKLDRGPAEAAWVGRQLSGWNVGAVLYVAVIGALAPALQPMLLGGLLEEQRLTAAQLGEAGTLELLGMAIATTAAGAWLKPVRLRSIGVAVGLVLLMANLATTYLSGTGILLARGVAGLAAGVYLWFLVCLLTRANSPARWTGVYLVVQSVTAVGLSALCGAVIIPRFGVSGGYAALAVVSATMVAASLMAPRQFDPVAPESAGRTTAPTGGLVALAAIGVYMAATLAVWIYLAPLSKQSGLPAAATATALSIALAMQMVGGGAAILIGNRISAMSVTVCSALAAAAMAAYLYTTPTIAGYTVTAATFGAVWMFAVSYQIPLVIAVDPSRRAAMLGGGAQLFGYAAGPAVASLVVRDADVRGAVLLGSLLFLLTVALAIVAYRLRDRGLPEAAVSAPAQATRRADYGR
jgi:hypothetical protein